MTHIHGGGDLSLLSSPLPPPSLLLPLQVLKMDMNPRNGGALSSMGGRGHQSLGISVCGVGLSPFLPWPSSQLAASLPSLSHFSLIRLGFSLVSPVQTRSYRINIRIPRGRCVWLLRFPSPFPAQHNLRSLLTACGLGHLLSRWPQ